MMPSNYTLAQAFAAVKVTPGQAAEVLQALAWSIQNPDLVRVLQTTAGEIGLLPLEAPEVEPPARTATTAKITRPSE